MRTRSLSWQTNLFFLGHQGEVLERDGYLVARTPAQPGYYWGNLLLFDAPPPPGSVGTWTALFAKEFADLPEVRHQTFAWDDPDGPRGAAAEFEAAGFEFDPAVFLVADSPRPPPHPNPDLVVRPLTGAADWDAAAACQVACRDPRFEEDVYRGFVATRMRAQRALVEAGHGRWYGGFLGGELVADLGVFMTGGGVARYQSVGTRPEFRRRGICGTLVYETARLAIAEQGATRLCMVADPEYHAARIYESVGFEPRERQAGLCRYPPAAP